MLDATLSLYYLSGFLYKYYGKKVIILLDEYDTPMQEAFVDGYWEQLVTFTRSLFNATFKTNPALERGIMTGITRVSKESIFSDLNNLKVVTTTSNEYAASFGFTEQEVFSALESFGLENVPDQNGEATHNSLCADTTQGNAETYLTTDVVNWAKKMLPVAKSARMWAMGGFSQGGTCTTQLVPRHPEIYGAMLPVDGELKPTNGSVAKMVQEYFAGDRKAYDEQVPVNAIASSGTSEQALFTGAGERDKESISNMRTIAAAARKAGMEVTELIVPGAGHIFFACPANFSLLAST